MEECRKLTHPPCDSSLFTGTTHGRSTAKHLGSQPLRLYCTQCVLWTKLGWQSWYYTNPLERHKFSNELTKKKTHTFLKRKTTDTWCYTQYYTEEPALFCHSSRDVMIHSQQSTSSSQKKGTGHASTQPPIRTPV